jgi:serine/threonine protein kinase
MNPRQAAPRPSSEDPHGSRASAPTELAEFSNTAVPVAARSPAAASDDALPAMSGQSSRSDLVPAAQRLGTTLLGKYRIEQLIGEGGCGRVYRATHLQLRAQVAIKFLLSQWASRPVFRERFRREARALALLSHPGIVGIHDFGEDGGDLYLVMEYVRGQPLSKLVLRNGQPMAPAHAVALIDQLLEVLSVAHDRGIIHRA